MRTLQRPQSFCSNPSCPSNHDKSAPCLASHGFFRTRTGQRRRRICKLCGTTASATAGTPYHRMRRPKGDLDKALRMSAEGMTSTAIARVMGVAPSTVTRWIEKAGRHAQAFSDEHGQIEEPTELQLDELKSYGIGEAGDTWKRYTKPDPPDQRKLTHPEPHPGKLLATKHQQPRRRNDRGESGPGV